MKRRIREENPKGDKNSKSRWKRLRAKVKAQKQAQERTTWRARYVRLYKRVGKLIRDQEIQEVRVLDLGCGVEKDISPTAENLKRLLELTGNKVATYTAVDKAITKGKRRGISYVKADIFQFLKRARIPKANVIVAQRVLEHLGRESAQKAKEFARLCWAKVPEKGFLVTEVQLVSKADLRSRPDIITYPNKFYVPIVVQKQAGKPKVVIINLVGSTAKFFSQEMPDVINTIRTKYKPTNYVFDMGSSAATRDLEWSLLGE